MMLGEFVLKPFNYICGNLFFLFTKKHRWVDFIPKLKCPQCVVYQASTLSQLECHVILHCKCRPPLLNNHFIKQLRIVSSVSNLIRKYYLFSHGFLLLASQRRCPLSCQISPRG